MIREHHTSDVVCVNCARFIKASSDISALNESGTTDKDGCDDKVDRVDGATVNTPTCTFKHGEDDGCQQFVEMS